MSLGSRYPPLSVSNTYESCSYSYSYYS